MKGAHILLFDEIDGTFPNHHPDPTVDKNLADLVRVVREQKCDLGIAFDGDGDRIGVVDDQGNILRCDILLALYAQDVLKRHPRATIIGDVKCSQVLFDAVAAAGGRPLMWKTGHSLIKAKMAETGAPLAGELSGHIFFKDGWYGFDDGIYCALRLIDAVIQNAQPLSQMTAGFPRMISTPEIRVEVAEQEKFSLMRAFVDSVKAHAARDHSLTVTDIDGVRVQTPDGWWLVRASNTQNMLGMRIEATSDAGLLRLREMLSKELLKIGVTL
jgi:phosphomannomutase